MSTILTYSGKHFTLLDPSPSEIDIFDIAHALSNICRFAGHTRRFYSVAQHSVIVSRIVPKKYALYGLLHDASEAYVADIVRPLKPHLKDYAQIEERIMEAVRIRFDLQVPVIPADVKLADMVALATEKRDLMHFDLNEWPCLAGVIPLKEAIQPEYPVLAKENFLARYFEIKTGVTL